MFFLVQFVALECVFVPDKFLFPNVYMTLSFLNKKYACLHVAET